MASPDSSAPTTVPSDIEDKLGEFKSQVLLMILSYVNGKFQNTTPSLTEHLIKLERDNDSYSGIINYTFKRLKVNCMHFFTPDRDTVQLPREKAKGIELRLALVDFLLSFNDQQTASRAIKKIAEGSSLLVLQMTPLEIVEEVCKPNTRSFEDVLSISISVAREFNHAGFFDYLSNTDWLHNSDDVNQFLIQESGFSSHSEEMALFMTQKLSTSDYTLISISKKLRGVCEEHPRGVIFCISVPIALLTLLLVGIGISMCLSYHSSNSTDQSMEIGDIQLSSALIPLPNNVSSVLLNIPSGVTVFIASSIPPTGTRINHTEIFQSDGRCGPYNCNGGNNPIYLLPGSIINYTLTVSNSNSSQCPAQLVLFDNKTEYNNCNYNSSSVIKAYCLTRGTVNHVSIRINKSANYYVTLVKEDLTISVSSNISVHQVYYDTSHLSPANDCEQNDASPCTVHNDDQWSCSNTEWYVILQSSSNADVGYNYKTPSFNYCRLIVSLNSTPVIAIILALLIGCCLVSQRKKICNKCKGSGSGRNGSIQNNLPSQTGYAPIP